MVEEIASLKTLILSLIRLHDADREADKEIAKHFGWTVVEKTLKDPTTSDESIRSDWFNHEGENLKVPRYTSNLDSAISLLALASPSVYGGFSWAPGVGAAKFNDEKPVQAKTPAIAICVQALLMRLRALQIPPNAG
ncbi:hypothetical protein [Neorhizobium sp. AL 9.2.2]|uniref:hypothetical protein n=1 Tax=Neorhizobium sp. AL 9.2.2 TaxID=2712894 RepID=UPI0015743883|nr:hypothetical protein [Neorhizobium sp. AL 9.2.2]NSY19997.1 hypothetical protein [Neorhizobium sp. AL 9.2.2]